MVGRGRSDETRGLTRRSEEAPGGLPVTKRVRRGGPEPSGPPGPSRYLRAGAEGNGGITPRGQELRGTGGSPPAGRGAPLPAHPLQPGPFPPQITRRTLWHLVRHRLPDSLCSLRMRGTPRSLGKQRLLSPALLAALRKHCPQLHRLCLTETDLRHVPYESIPSSVTTLELNLCDIPDAWFCVSPLVPPPQVQHLAIHSIPTFSDHHLLDISSQNHLKTLSLCGTYRITDMGIQAAAPHLEELERLILRHCIIGDAAMVFIGRHMKQLRYLEISNAYFLTNRGLVSIATLEHLETLCLDLYDLVSLGTVIALLQVLPRLNHLKLGGTCFEDEVLHKIQENFPHCAISHTP